MHIFKRIIVFSFCAAAVSSVVYEDLDLQSIVIDDSEEFTFDVIPPPAEDTTTQIPGVENSCQNSNGVAGTCLKLGECFPYLADVSEDSLENSYPIYDILRSVAEDCPQKGLVCCPDFASQKFPTKKPAALEADTYLASNSSLQTTYGIRENCGANTYEEPDIKLLGGVDAKPGEFPFMVSLVKGRGHICGGSLLDSQWVLTAAHCIANIRNLGQLTVNVGDHDVTKQNEVTHQSRKVKKAFYNKGFSFDTLQHDIALLQLSTPVTFGSSAQPVCLSNTPGPAEGTQGKVVLCGWGKKGSNLPPAAILQKVRMAIVPIQKCRSIYSDEKSFPPITDNQMCAGEKGPVRDACNGDSGGPLSVISGNGKALQVGIVSFGDKKCGAKPAVYTRVDKYISWIKKHAK